MKRLIYTFSISLSLIFIGLFIQSCNNEVDITEFTQEQKFLLERYAVVGIEHNDAMTDIFNSLKKETKSINIKKGDDLVEVVRQKTEKVLQSKGMYNKDLIDLDKFFNVNREKTKSAGEDI
ncbi:MAG: hypothetical protein LBT43_19355 [Prevotella sp.]|jgi:hypothetical protein|nr:hypothetical protein [Prevotella sp.]